MSDKSTFDRLVDDVYAQVGRPVNAQVVRALLESMSIRDLDAQRDFNATDLQSLATDLYQRISDETYLENHPDPILVNSQFMSDGYLAKDFLRLKLRYFAKFYPLGLFHGLPVFLQISTIILFGYSMWTWIGFNQLQSTAVVLGVIFGLVGTGGFVQVIGRQVSHYWLNRDFEMVKRSTLIVFRDALIFMGLLSITFLIVDSFANFYPYEFLYLVFVYSFSIGILLLLSAVFHPIKERWMITLAFIVGAGISLYLKLYTSMETYYTHWIGIWIANGLMIAYLLNFFRKSIKEAKSYNRTTSKNVVMIYRNYKYFFYGLLFFVFIFIDRILAWSTSPSGYLPYVVYYEKNYEIGMDIAILIFFLLVGVLEYGITSFSSISDILQKQTPYNKPEILNNKALKMYNEHVAILISMGIIMGALLYFVIWDQLGYERAFEERLDLISIKVSIIGGLGYILLAWGMLNSLYLFTLNKPSKPLSAILTACAVNLFVGWLASRLISYEYSVVGMLCGSFTFMYITRKYSLKFFKNLDYYYYAAY